MSEGRAHQNGCCGGLIAIRCRDGRIEMSFGTGSCGLELQKVLQYGHMSEHCSTDIEAAGQWDKDISMYSGMMWWREFFTQH